MRGSSSVHLAALQYGQAQQRAVKSLEPPPADDSGRVSSGACDVEVVHKGVLAGRVKQVSQRESGRSRIVSIGGPSMPA